MFLPLTTQDSLRNQHRNANRYPPKIRVLLGVLGLVSLFEALELFWASLFLCIMSGDGGGGSMFHAICVRLISIPILMTFYAIILLYATYKGTVTTLTCGLCCSSQRNRDARKAARKINPTKAGICLMLPSIVVHGFFFLYRWGWFSFVQTLL